MKKILFVISLAVSLFLGGCRSAKTVTEVNGDWSVMTMPFKINIEGSVSPSGKAYFMKDSCIYLSVRFFGMEVVSFYANNDSAFFYDKTHNILVADALGKDPVTGKKLTADRLQEILLGVGRYAKDYTFKSPGAILSVIPEEERRLPGGNIVEKWKFEAASIKEGKGMCASLTWNPDDVKWDNGTMPQWKRPARPKTVMGIDDIYLLFSASN